MVSAIASALKREGFILPRTWSSSTSNAQSRGNGIWGLGLGILIEVIEEAGRYLGEGVAQLINIFNPALIILGGRVSQAGELLLDAVRGTAMRYSHVMLNRDVQFVVSGLGPTAGALGVAMLAARDIFDVERLNPSAYV